MCGRSITPDQVALERGWGQLPGDIEYFPSYNFAPTMRGPVVVDTDEDPDKLNARGRAVRLMTWGFQPHWAKRSWINARAETVFENRAFAKDAKKHRCLVLLAYDAWLWPNSDPQDYRAVTVRPDDAEYEVFPVSKAVNSSKNDSPELLARVSP